ncbi:MAG TPA: Gfo/Idh/MocA family oxidoreductase [Terriglobales bacterium]|nr:Gfo/Idh/MocA family oxidoreductase [Terriglobales bacterium]
MILVDRALAERQQNNNPVRVAIVGAGYSGRTVAHQILHSFPGMRLVAISNRTLSAAQRAYTAAGVSEARTVTSPAALEQAIRDGVYAVTEDPAVVCDANGIDAIIEATGTIEFGAGVVLRAIEHGKNVILLNCELDATLGPILKARAARAGVMYSNTDGDEPGVAMNMIRFVRSIGLKPLVAGNLKGLYDPYRTPETQRKFAEANNQKATTMTSFADGTKLSVELNVLANATGFGVGKRGMYGPALAHVNDSPKFFADKLRQGGMVDFLCGAAPNNGAFVVAHTEDPVKAAYLKYLKMGEGPLYTFYTPFHLPQLEIPLTVARAVLFRDATVSPLGAPVCDSVAIAKRDLKAGEVLDGLGGFTCYTLIENYDQSLREQALPIGVSEGCVLTRDVAKDQLVTYADVKLPAGRLCDRLRREQQEFFAAGATPAKAMHTVQVG